MALIHGASHKLHSQNPLATTYAEPSLGLAAQYKFSGLNTVPSRLKVI